MSLALAFCCAFGLPPACAAPVERASIGLELRDQVRVDRLEIVLSDVLVDGTSVAPELQPLLNLPLGRIPSDGGSVTLDRRSLLRWLRVRSGIDPQRVHWAGSPVSHIQLAVVSVSGERVAEVARLALLGTLSRQGFRVDISASQFPADFSLPTGRLELRPRLNTDSSPLSAATATPANAGTLAKHQCVWVDAWVGGRFIRTVPVALDVSVHALAYVASRDLPAGDRIEPTRPSARDFTVREVDWAGRSGVPMMVVAQESTNDDRAGAARLAGATSTLPATSQLRHSVRAGQPLSADDLAPAALVTRGGFAILRLREGSVQLESRVEVLQDGTEGQTVRVRLANANGSISARVTAAGAVEILQ